jgi:opacity protein-like surface antigen
MSGLRLAAALVVLLVPAAASAQDASKGDVFAGYSMVARGGTDTCPDCEGTAAEGTTLQGFHAAVGWGLSDRIGLLFDVSGHYGSNAQGTDVSTLSLMAGPRLNLGGGRLRPFLHVIGGVVRFRESLSIFEVDISESSTGFGGAAGGGVDIGFADRWAVRLAADYRVVSVDDETVSEPRFSAGVAYRFGVR